MKELEKEAAEEPDREPDKESDQEPEKECVAGRTAARICSTKTTAQGSISAAAFRTVFGD